MTQESGRSIFLFKWVPVLVVLVGIGGLLLVWYSSFPPETWEETPGYLDMYVDYLVNNPGDAFLRVETGPTGRQSWFVIPVYLGVGLLVLAYAAGKIRKEVYVVMNRRYIIYLVVLAVFAITFHNAAQFYNWYWNPELNAPGFVDTWTHITSPWLIAALISPLALGRFLHWERRSMWFFIFAINMTAALGWEIAESGASWDPDPNYFNYPMDSLKDLILGGLVATVIGTWIYERLVIDVEQQSRLPHMSAKDTRLKP